MNEIEKSWSSKKWKDVDLVAFDTETSGAYPVGFEIVEIGAVKYRDGQIIGEFKSFIRPSRPMSDFIIGIHGITNEMVADAPEASEVIRKFRDFIGESCLVAHHAPFDLGFLVYEFEKFNLPALTGPLLCTSLLGRKLIHETSNHKLQTLVSYFKFDGGTAHRALDDAKACLSVALECFKRAGAEAKISDLQKLMGKPIKWELYSLIGKTTNPRFVFLEALKNNSDVEIIYSGGSIPGTRRITPLGIIRNPDGDYVQAICHVDRAAKRFYLEKIKEAQLVTQMQLKF